MLAEWDKHWLTMRLNSSLWALIVACWGWLSNSGNGDSLDWYWYNNEFAAGDQMYPSGINKYYDMYSFDGILSYMTAVLWYELCDLVGIMFIWGVPLDFIINAINGLSWDNFVNFIWYYIPGGDWMVWGWSIKVQDGWNMM